MAVATVNINAVDNMSATLANLQQQLNNLQQQANNIVINPQAGNAAQNAFTNLNAQARILESTMNRLGNVVWSQFVSALKDAYQEIKNIDDQLVVVRRVTGKTSQELAGMTKHAFDIAQKYGVSASDYLHGVAQFTRAGYGEQAEGLAELSVQLQRAGDVSATVADQYMTAVDKAYNMQGSVEALTAAMDGANQIGNEYATTVGEIAAGIGKVASIAATGHVGINELTAALGTITAVTQRSGTEAATALRAIFLNIMGNTQTEIEEGAKWTAGEIEGLRQVLELYAPDVVAAAEATNTLIDPMEAIGALAKSYKDGVLTEAKLFSMVSDIGGKLRTNQLMVLIKNWDMYESMLGTFANASGSISREIANSMDSITVKTEQMKAAWVAMVNDSVSTSTIKGFLDGLKEAINLVGNLRNMFLLVLGVVTTLKSQRLGTLFAGMFGGGVNAATAAATTIRSLGVAATILSVAIGAVNKIVKEHNDKIAEQQTAAKESAQSAATHSDEIMKLYSSYITATEGTEAYTTALKALAEALGMTAEEAKNAGEGIDGLTEKELRQAVADASTAMDYFEETQGKQWMAKSFTINFGEYYNQGLAQIYSKYRDLFKDIDGDRATFSVAGNLEEIISQYEAILELQKELRLYATENGINIAKFGAYGVTEDYLSGMEETYKNALAYVQAWADAVANLKIFQMSARDEMVKANADMADGQADAFNTDQLEEYGAALDELAREIAVTYDMSTVKGRKLYETVMEQIAKMFPNLIKFSKEYSKYSGTDGLTDGADSATDSVNRLAQALSTATKAKSEFDKAMENTPKENAGFSDYQSAYSAYAAEIEAGRVNSAIAMAAAKYLMAGSGKFDFDKIFAEGGYKGVNAAMKKGPWAMVFGDSEEQYGEGFIDLLAKTANKAGEIMDSTGKRVIGTYKQTKDGIDFTIDDMLELSKVTGLSLDQIWQSIQALGVYGETGHTGVESIIGSLADMGKEAGVTATETGKLSVDYGKLLQFMKDSGKKEQDWDDMKQWLDFLNEIGMIDLTNVPDVAEGWQNYKDWAADAAESAGEAAESMGEAADSAEKTVEETPEAGEAEFTKANPKASVEAANAAHEAAEAIYNEYNAVLSGLSAADYTVTVKADGGQVWETVQTAETELGTVTRTRTIEIDAQGNIQQIQDVELIMGEVSRTRTVNFDANGDIANIEVVEVDANTAARTRSIYYYTNGQITGLEQTVTNAEGVTQEVRFFKYGANGELLVAQVKAIDEEAGTVTTTTRFINYDANGKPLYARVETLTQFADGSTEKTWYYVFDGNGDGVIDEIDEAEGSIVASTDAVSKGSLGEYDLQGVPDGVLTAISEAEKALKDSTDTPYYYRIGAQFQDPKTGNWYTIDAPSEAEMSSDDYYHGVSMGYDRNTGMFVEHSGRADEENGSSEDWYFRPGMDDQWTRHVRRETTYDENGNAVTRWIEETLDEAGDIIEKHFTGDDAFTPPVIDFETDPEKIAEMAREASEEAEEDLDPLSFEVEDDEGSAAEAGEKAGEDAADAASEYLDEYGGFVPELLGLDDTYDKPSFGDAVQQAHDQAQAEADANPVKLKTIPDLDGAFMTEQNQFFDENGNPVITAQFEVELENGDAVVDYLSYIDEVTGEEHVIKIMTENDGTQTIEETVTDAEGLQKTYVTTIDAEGNAVTTLETAEALATSLERVVTLTTNATGNANARLNDLWVNYKKLNGKKLTITTVVEGDKLPELEENAKGTDSFRGGLSLINEEGPELIAANGWAKILGHGDPTVAKIPKGARIYTAEETARILNGVGGEKFWAFANGNDTSGMLDGGESGYGYGSGIVLPKKDKPKEEPKDEPKDTGSGGSSKDDKNEFWDTIKEYLEYGLKKIEYSIKEYEMSITLLERARDKILKPILDELATLEYTMSMLDYEVKLLERARDDAVKPLDEQIEKLKEARQIDKEDEALEEKKLAVEEARANLLDVMHQRTVRYFNEESGQWEWMVDHKAVQQAQEQLDKAEKDYEDAQADYEITLLERQKADIEKTYQEQIDALQAQIDEMDRRKEDLEHDQEKITYEYDQSIKPLQEQMDDLQAVYDDLQYYYDRLVDAVEVPTESLSAALTQMSHAAEQYSSQLQDTVKLLDTLYELAPTFSAIEMGDLGQYTAQESHMGDYKADDHSQTVYIERMQVFGEKGRMLGDALRNAGIYRN